MPIDLTQPVELEDGTPLSNVQSYDVDQFYADVPQGYSERFDGCCDEQRLFRIEDGRHVFNALPNARNVTGERAAVPEREPGATPAEPERLPFDPMQPLELSDGTPVTLTSASLDGDTYSRRWTWTVRMDEANASLPFGDTVVFTRNGGFADGTDDGNRREWPTLRNVDPSVRVPQYLRKARRDYARVPAELKPDFLYADWFVPHADVHFPMLVERDEVAMVSFFENERKLEADRRTEMRVGRYVRRFNGGKLKDEEVEQIAASSDVKLRGNRVKITQDANEIEDVYVNGPNTCMSEDAYGYDTGGIHPARVYAGPDLGIAYIGEPDDPSSRCVVWPEKKRYGRIYGDETRMEQMLRNMGYESGSMRGARVRLIECDQGTVMPYVDNINGARIDGNYAVLGEGHDLDTSNTNGLGSDSNRVMCEHCDDTVDANDTTTVYSNRYDCETWCDSCRSDDATYCSYFDEYVRDDLMADVIDSNGHSDSCAEFVLERNDFIAVTAGDHANEYVHIDLTVEHGGEWYHVDDAPEPDEETDDVPTVTVEEAEAAGQLALPLPTGRFRVRRTSEGTTGHVWFNENHPTANHVRRDASHADALALCDYITDLHGRRHTYTVEPSVGEPEDSHTINAELAVAA